MSATSPEGGSFAKVCSRIETLHNTVPDLNIRSKRYFLCLSTFSNVIGDAAGITAVNCGSVASAESSRDGNEVDGIR